jgi:hypothetical protein
MEAHMIRQQIALCVGLAEGGRCPDMSMAAALHETPSLLQAHHPYLPRAWAFRGHLAIVIIWESTDDPDDYRTSLVMLLGMRPHFQQQCGAADVALDRGCGKPSDAQLNAGCFLHFAILSRLCIGIQNLVHDRSHLQVLAFAPATRIGTNTLLELRMLWRLSIATS